MNAFSILRDGTADGGAWPDLREKMEAGKVLDLTGDNAPLIVASRVPNGTREGNSTVILRITIPPSKGGGDVLIETTMRLFCQAGRLFEIIEREEGGR